MNRNNSNACSFFALFLVAAILTVAGCMTVGPDYIKPTPSMPEYWHHSTDPALVPNKASIYRWWVVFEDPMLTQLIEQAADSNLDLKLAVARVNEARARLGVVSGERVPMIDATGDISRQRGSENGASIGGTTFTRNAMGLDASWEVDLFGRVRRSIEEAAANLESVQEDRTDVMVTMYAEVALTYLAIRTFQARLAAASGNIDSQRQVLALTRSRFKHGLATDLDVAQAERILGSSEAEVPPLRIELSRAINTIGVLLGRNPGTFFEELSTGTPIPLPPDKITVGIPADLLRQRPDIRRAERELAAQTARIGIATADLYPSLSLTGTFGLAAIDSKNLFESNSRAFSFGPSVRWNLFDGNRIRNQIKVEDARTEQALLRYEQTLLNALNETENALKAYMEQQLRLEALERTVVAARRSVKLSTGLYKEGLTDFQNVLDAQRALFAIENQLAESRGNTVAILVLLYKALGGGWDPDEGTVTGARHTAGDSEHWSALSADSNL